jgi:hypothetical protein
MKCCRTGIGISLAKSPSSSIANYGGRAGIAIWHRPKTKSRKEQHGHRKLFISVPGKPQQKGSKQAFARMGKTAGRLQRWSIQTRKR